jgi:hypothetical protein
MHRYVLNQDQVAWLIRGTYSHTIYISVKRFGHIACMLVRSQQAPTLGV